MHRHFHLEDDIAQVPALTYLRRLCDDLSGILGVPVEVDGEHDLLPTTSIQPVGLIVNELVTNAAKHGAGKINVTYKSGDTVRELIVCDQGKGLPDGFDPARKRARPRHEDRRCAGQAARRSRCGPPESVRHRSLLRGDFPPLAK